MKNSKIYQLPEIFAKKKLSSCTLVFYNANQSSVNNKAHFTQNMLCFLLDGKKSVKGKNFDVSFDANQLFLLAEGNVLMSEKMTQKNKYASVLLFFSNAFLNEFLFKYKINLNQTSEHDKQHILLEKDDFILNFEIALNVYQKRKVSSEMLELKIEEILLYLYETQTDVMSDFFLSILHRSQSKTLIDLMHLDTIHHLSVDEMAFLCHMSASTFKRKFNKEFGTSPKKYLQDRKMELALLLLNRKKRPSEIYSELGYENLSAFSSEFKKYYGAAPKFFKNDRLE